MIIQFVINFIFLLELFLDVYILGLTKTFSHKGRAWVELFCAILNIIALVNYAEIQNYYTTNI